VYFLILLNTNELVFNCVGNVKKGGWNVLYSGAVYSWCRENLKHEYRTTTLTLYTVYNDIKTSRVRHWSVSLLDICTLSTQSQHKMCWRQTLGLLLPRYRLKIQQCPLLVNSKQAISILTKLKKLFFTALLPETVTFRLLCQELIEFNYTSRTRIIW